MRNLQEYNIDELLDLLDEQTLKCNNLFVNGYLDKAYREGKKFLNQLVSEIMKRMDVGLADEMMKP